MTYDRMDFLAFGGDNRGVAYVTADPDGCVWGWRVEPYWCERSNEWRPKFKYVSGVVLVGLIAPVSPETAETLIFKVIRNEN